MINEENKAIRDELIKKLPLAKDEKEYRAIAEAIKATTVDDDLDLRQQEIDLKVIAQQSDEELRKQEIKAQNKRSFRQVSTECFKGIFTIVSCIVGICGTIAVNDRIMDRTEDPDNPTMKRDPRVCKIISFWR